MSTISTDLSDREHVDHLVETLEAIANFSTGPAGPAARSALVATGYWPLCAHDPERPHPTDTWLATGAPMPCHDIPAPDAVAAALASGRAGLFAATFSAVHPDQLAFVA